jgi:hypothetical protein
MTRSMWMNAWDLQGIEPDRMIDSLLELGLDGCRLGLSYHGGRMLLPNNAKHVVYRQHPGAVYFKPQASRYGSLQPAASPLAKATELFLERCAVRSFPAQAWTVLCHNDYLGDRHRQCCVRNAFGEHYTYALCPSHPEVQRYIISLCGEIAALPGIEALDLEALSFMGYEHNSLHDKRGIALPPEVTKLLSICFCRFCSASLPEPASVRERIRNYFQTGEIPVAEGWLENAVLSLRRETLLGLLKHLAPASINLRFTPDPTFTGGKTALSWADAATVAQAVTLTFFGSAVEQMRTSLANVPANRNLKIDAGFMFHLPDCNSARQIAKRLELAQQAGLNGVAFYSYSMAAPYQLDWLRSSIKDLKS